MKVSLPNESEKFIIKEYPLRMDQESKLYDICSCGHAWFRHEVVGNDCRECTCPKYEYQQKLTMTQLTELEIKIRMTNKTSGFTQ